MTLRLAGVATAQWADVDGWAVSKNIPRLESLPLDRFAHLVWFWATRNAEEKDVTKFRTRLWMPPKGEAADKRGPWSPEAETSAFKALKAGLKK